MTRVLVLHARLDRAAGNPVPGTGFQPGGADAFPALLERLPYAKRLELERRHAAGRHAGLAGIWLALEGVSRLRGHPAEPGLLRFPQDGRPYLEGGPFFSVSHCASHVATAISDDLEIGFDMEETGETRSPGAKSRQELERWTATEAVLKAAGRGLRDVRSVELEGALRAARLAGRHFVLRPVQIAAEVVAHLAAPRTVESLVIEGVDLPGAAV